MNVKMEAAQEQRRCESVLWLLSYPKSGNTWLRFITFHLKMGRMPADSREIDRMTGSWGGKGAEIRCILKSHAQRSALEGVIRESDSAIYFHRHPLDVMQSALNYAFLNGEIGLDDSVARELWIRRYIKNRGNRIWFEPRIAAGRWTDHIRDWLAPQPIPILTLSYDAAVDQPAHAVRSIADFLKLDISERALQECVNATSFDSLKAFEEQEVERAAAAGRRQGRYTAGIRTTGLSAGLRFFSKGRKGSYQDTLSPHEIKAAWAVFRDVAEPLGYRL